MLDFIERNGALWRAPSVDEAAFMIENLAAGRIAEADFGRWVAEHIEPRSP